VTFLDRLLSQTATLPGVVAAGVTSRIPLIGQVGGSILSVEGTSAPRLERPIVATAIVDPGYFRAIGLQLEAGRLLDQIDRAGGRVAIISSAVAERAWPQRDPVGQRFRLGPDDAPLVEVVGVVGSVRGEGLTDPPTLDVYFPYWQDDWSLYSDRLFLVTRAASRARNAVPVRDVVRGLDPELPVPSVRSFSEIAEDSIAQRRFLRNTVLVVAVFATFLTSVGIFGVLSQWVAERRKELGIRWALGASSSNLVRLIVGRAALPIALGLIGGIAGSAILSGISRRLLFGTEPLDPIALTAASVVVGGIAVASVWVPARRAARVDPPAALRQD
jgi:putative ABC transport system permease protein